MCVFFGVCGLWLLLGPFGLGVATRPVSHTLAWTAAAASAFAVDQCTNTRQGCRMAQAALVAGEVRELTIGGLDRRQSYCWRVRLPATGQQSNIVCTP